MNYMSEFITRVIAELDLSNAEAKMNSFMNKKHNIDIDVNIKGMDKFDGGAFAQQAAKAGQKAGKSFSESMSSQIRNIQNSMNNFKFDASLAKMNSQLSKFSGQSNGGVLQATKALESYKHAYEDLKRLKGDDGTFNMDDAGVVASFNKMTTASEKFKNAMTIVNAETSKTASSTAKLTAANQITTWANNNTRAIKIYKDALDDLTTRAKNATTVGELQTVKQEFREIQTEAAKLGKTGNSWTTEFGRAFSQIGQFVGIYGGIQKGIQTTKQMVTEVIKIDTAMTNLKKVTDETNASYSNFLSNSGKTAKSLGADVSSYITQTSEWAKLGFGLKSSEQLSKTSMIYSNVGEVDDKTAVGDLVTAMKAFNIEADNSLQIVDSLNALSNKYAVSAAGLGEGLKNSASALSMQGNSLEQVLAMLTGGGEITQSPGELGNALKVVSFRLASMKGKLSEIGEEYENINSVSKNQTEIYNMTKGQVNILDEQNGKLKNTYTILEEVAGAWDSINNLERSELAELMFGKNRANEGLAVIQGFQSGQVQKALADALNSEGSAQAEQDKWMNSLEAKINSFKAAFQELSSATLDSDFLKGAVDGATALLEVLTQIVSVGGGIPAILAGIGGFKLFKNLD